MQLNLGRLDERADRPTIRISYDSSVQCHYIHRDFYGPYNTLVRICLLRIPDGVPRETQHYLDMLVELGVNIGGYVRLRYDVESRHLITCIAATLTQNCPPPVPSPTNPMLPDHEAMVPAAYTVCTVNAPMGDPGAVDVEVDFEYREVVPPAPAQVMSDGRRAYSQDQINNMFSGTRRPTPRNNRR